MGKKKMTPIKVRLIRLPKSLDDRLRRMSTERSIQTDKAVSVNRIIVEAIEKSLSAA